MGILFFCMGEGCVSMWAVWILSGEVTKTNVQILLLTHALVDHYPPPPPSTTGLSCAATWARARLASRGGLFEQGLEFLALL